MAKQPLGGRPNKAALAKMKAVTVAVSIATFVGTLGAVSILNPASANTTASTSQAQSSEASTIIASTGSSRFGASGSSSTSNQQPSVMPLVRTRGS